MDAMQQLARLIELLRVVAPRSSQVLNTSDAASTIAASERSIRTWLQLLVSDPGLLCHLIGADTQRLTSDTVLLGQVLETFVGCELQRQGVWAQRAYRLHHVRDRDGREVDLVAERADGSIVGIEVMATATPRSSDAAGLRHLRERACDRWRGGALVTLSGTMRRWDHNIVALPLSALWEGATPVV